MAEARPVEREADAELLVRFGVAILESYAPRTYDEAALAQARTDETESVRTEILRRMAAAREE